MTHRLISLCTIDKFFGFILLDVLVAQLGEEHTMIIDTLTTGRVLLLISRIIREENELAQFCASFRS